MDIKTCKKKRILVFAGTYEGHQLAKAFAERKWQSSADFCVATDYGSEMLTDIPGLSVLEGRLNLSEMEELMAAGDYGLVIDATHPYANIVTENIRGACENQSIS